MYLMKYFSTEKVEALFTSELEKGDRRKAMTRLRVPPFDSKKTDWSTLGLGVVGGMFLVMVSVIIASAYVMTMSRGVPISVDQVTEALSG